MEITIRHIRQLETVARHGNFQRAAMELNISQPALSRSIAGLEEQLGIKLLDRLSRGVVPTRYGEHVIDRGRLILQEMHLVHRDLSLLQGMEAGEIFLGCGPFPAQTFIGKALGSFCRNYPRIDIRVDIGRTPGLLSRLRSRELDLFVADLRIIDDPERFSIQPMPTRQGYFCCRAGHPLTELAQPTPQDIGRFPLALMWLPEELRKQLDLLLSPGTGGIAHIRGSLIRCDSLRVLFDIIASSDAIGLTTREALANAGGEGLCLLPIIHPQLTTKYGIVRLKDRTLPQAIATLEDYIIRAEAAASAAWTTDSIVAPMGCRRGKAAP